MQWIGRWRRAGAASALAMLAVLTPGCLVAVGTRSSKGCEDRVKALEERVSRAEERLGMAPDGSRP